VDHSRNRIDLFVRLTDRASLFVANLALAVMLGTVCWTVISRYLLHTPVSWAEDINSIAFAWFIFIGMVAVHNRRGHIGLDVFTSALPPWIQVQLGRARDAFVAVFCFYTAYLCGAQSYVSHTSAYTTALKIPLSFFFSSLAIGFFLMAVRSITFLFGSPALEDRE
jgi:TRAP-type C4-dicarboxylate transport system permease small subunit